jgi:death-on-curing protein
VKEPIWIREIEALELHGQQIRLFGGSPGVRDRGLLESALARPLNLFAYTERPLTLADLAAAYAFGISSNHPFFDGNKRTAMHVSFVFLEFNGAFVTASQEEAYLAFLRLAAGEMDEAALAHWFAEHTSVRE